MKKRLFKRTMSLVRGANKPPTRANIMQSPMQLDRITVGNTSLAYTKSAVKAHEIPKIKHINSQHPKIAYQICQLTTEPMKTVDLRQTLAREKRRLLRNDIGLQISVDRVSPVKTESKCRMEFQLDLSVHRTNICFRLQKVGY